VTRHVALVGKPLRRRHSQVMHEAAFAAAGIDAHYELRELEEDELPDFVARARDPDWFGLQVTAPYKRTVMPLLDDPSTQA
jgi:shikimate dehydrogenase